MVINVQVKMLLVEEQNWDVAESSEPCSVTKVSSVLIRVCMERWGLEWELLFSNIS